MYIVTFAEYLLKSIFYIYINIYFKLTNLEEQKWKTNSRGGGGFDLYMTIFIIGSIGWESLDPPLKGVNTI